MVKKVSHAGFDEKMSVVNLLFSGTGQFIRKAVQQGEILEKVFEILKQVREALQHGADPEFLLDDFVQRLQMEWEKKRQSELLVKREDFCYRKSLELLESYSQALKKAGNVRGEEAFNVLKNVFFKDREVYEQQFDAAGNALEYAFDFMDAAFYNSQEMVVFVSNLNMDFYSIQFLKEYECERYYRYNRELLFEDVSREIRKRIETL